MQALDSFHKMPASKKGQSSEPDPNPEMVTLDTPAATESLCLQLTSFCVG